MSLNYTSLSKEKIMTSLSHAETRLATRTSLRSLAAILQTDSSYSQLLLRATLGLVLLPHGAQHLLGMFGGYGLSGTVQWMTGALGIPAPIAVTGVLLEFFAPLLLILGLAVRPAALSLAIFMAVAAATHVSNGFFMNWFGTMPAGVEGFEYHLLAIAMAVAIIGRGAGALSLDRLLTPRQ
jgi:putative oxidoreductase